MITVLTPCHLNCCMFRPILWKISPFMNLIYFIQCIQNLIFFPPMWRYHTFIGQISVILHATNEGLNMKDIKMMMPGEIKTVHFQTKIWFICEMTGDMHIMDGTIDWIWTLCTTGVIDCCFLSSLWWFFLTPLQNHCASLWISVVLQNPQCGSHKRHQYGTLRVGGPNCLWSWWWK